MSKITKSHDVDSQTSTFTLKDDAGKVVSSHQCVLSELSEKLQIRVALHGIGQKIGDIESAKSPEKRFDIQVTEWKRLTAKDATWNKGGVDREATVAVSDFEQALLAAGQTPEQVKVIMDNAKASAEKRKLEKEAEKLAKVTK